MHGILGGVLAATDVDPATVRPSPYSAMVFGFLLVATVLLLWSMVRHLRRARTNLGPARALPGTADGAPRSTADRVEGDLS